MEAQLPGLLWAPSSSALCSPGRAPASGVTVPFFPARSQRMGSALEMGGS